MLMYDTEQILLYTQLIGDYDNPLRKMQLVLMPPQCLSVTK